VTDQIETGSVAEQKVRVGLSVPPGPLRRWWAVAVLALVVAAAVAYYLYNERRKRILEAELVAACARDQRDACGALCARTPPDYAACYRLGKVLSTGSPTQRDEDRATRLFDKVCATGHADACAQLGRAYYNGSGAKRDLSRARIEFEASCRKNSALGCAGLGHMIMLGQGGLPRDTKKSFDLFQSSCNAGEPRGCASLAVAYLNGAGTDRDLGRAYSIFDRTCQQGIDRGCLGKGAMLFEGQGVNRDEKGAVGLFRKACDGETKDACAYLAMAYLAGRGVERSEQRALALFAQACEAAPPAGCAVLGEIYASGQASDDDPKAAEKYYRRACEFGLPEGCLAIGMATLTGALGIARDEQKGATLIRDACEKDKSLLACSQLAMLELQGVGPIQKDPANARRRADEACTGGYPPACSLVGTLLLHGAEGREPAQAARYFEKACEAGDGAGCALQGAQLVDGDGIARDRTKGLELIKLSCEQLNAHQGCAMYARALMLGSEGHDGLKKGVNLAERLCAQAELNSCLLAAAGYIEGRGVERDLERGARFLVVACEAGLEPACKLEKRLPADVVSKVEKQARDAIAQAAAAHSARAVPSGLPSFLPQPGP
jgi:uncharacterized protein